MGLAHEADNPQIVVRRKHRVAGHVGGPIGEFPKNSDLTSSVGRGLLGSGNRQSVFYATGKGVPELPIRIEDVLAA
jgi:hypothetical protein